MRIAWIALPAALLAGCSAAPPVTGTQAAGTAAAPSCHAQYETWKHGTASAAITRLKFSLRGVQAAGNAGDMLRLRAALEKTGRAAKHLAATPPPRCADPRGYYGQMLAKIRAAGDNAKAAGGLGGIILAEAPLKAVPAAEKKLNAELDGTVGKKR